MRIIILALSGLSLFLQSCVGDSPMAGYSQCYYGATDRDTTGLYVDQDGDQVRGEMYARYFNMEPQQGRFKGQWQGNILQGEFHYPQEGQTVMRQVHFKRMEDGRLAEGFGKYLTVDGKQVYEHSDFIHFDHVHRLESVPCR